MLNVTDALQRQCRVERQPSVGVELTRDDIDAGELKSVGQPRVDVDEVVGRVSDERLHVGVAAGGPGL